ncbi:MAG: hypothetical protein KatS3mg029_0408 [Saprospiraceae bacterium]|nr:MAG: hypothetical protein KatS3mg029_0408 [Saprospiraceae bacterium]
MQLHTEGLAQGAVQLLAGGLAPASFHATCFHDDEGGQPKSVGFSQVEQGKADAKEDGGRSAGRVGLVFAQQGYERILVVQEEAAVFER